MQLDVLGLLTSTAQTTSVEQLTRRLLVMGVNVLQQFILSSQQAEQLYSNPLTHVDI